MPAAAVPPSVPSTAYFTVTCRPLAADSDTVKSRFAVPLSPSDTLALLIDTVGASSSSWIVSVTDDGFAEAEPDTPPAVVPDTVTCLSASSALLSTADTVTVPVLPVEPAAIVSVGLALRLKSLDIAPLPAAADTVTVICTADAWLSDAVTADTLLSGAPES